MASLPVTSLPRLTESDAFGTWSAFERLLPNLSNDQLLTMFTSATEALAAQTGASLLSRTLSDYASTLDSPVLRSTETATRSPSSDRPRERPSLSPRPSSLDLLASSQRLGPRLAAKLVASSARAQGKRSR